MIRDITIGQYYRADSPIHKMDARFKLIAISIYVVSLFIINDLISYVFAIGVLAGVIAISQVPLSFMLKGIKSIFIIVILTGLLNVFATQGETVIAKIGIFTATMEGVYMAIRMVVRLIMLIMASSLLTLTTTPIQLTDAIEYILKPFKRIGVPSHEIAMMMTIALRFIPILLDETDKIIKAQQARGADFETGNIMQRAKSLVPILVPLFISALRRADELAMAMEARCYVGGDKRTRMNERTFTRYDYVGMVAIAFYIATIAAMMTFLT